MLRDNFFVKLKLKSSGFLVKNKFLILEGKEASIEETLEFLEKTEKANFEAIEYLYNFLDKASKWKINKKIFKKYILNNISDILKIIKKTYIKGVFEEKTKEKIEEKKEKIPMSFEDIQENLGDLLAFLSEKMCIDPNRILKKYTWRQIDFRTKKYIRRERDKTKEGRKINEREDTGKEIAKHKTEIDKSLKRIEKYLQSKK